MSPHSASGLIDTLEQLEALFGEVGQASIQKEQAFIHPHYRAMIEASPFAVLATSGPGGLDASPRGDTPGFVVVEDEQTLLLPDRRGNNRIDSLRNLIADPRMALLFLIPGLGETLRVNGTARISVAPELLQRFAVDGKPPKCVLVIRVETAYFQCARAIQRSRLWLDSANGLAAGLPSPGTMLADFSNAQINAEQYDRELPERQRTTLY
ncbi:pyridoxamine 5'-phosphate oxidase family protein [Pseudoduganella guangdongensis]|uniref:pyridoxamine 5'-phosphate oxidase family protein n=1 Tax=Pseudoduganella guangdongensis TaxID=2692179 RepID=UPI003530B909